MTFFDYHGNVCKIKLINEIKSDSRSNIYHYNPEWVLKRYNHTCPNDCRLNKTVYNIAERIKSPYIIEIKDLLLENKIENTNPKHLLKIYPIDAYTYKYIKPEEFDMLTIPTDYITDNINELSKIMLKFTKYGIQAVDLKVKDTTIQKDKIVLMDLEKLKKTSLPINILDNENYRVLLCLLKELLINCIINYEHDYDLKITIQQLFKSIYQFSDISTMKEIIKYFEKYKYPIDAIKIYKKRN